MKSRITKHALGSFRPSIIQMKVVFPSEAHTAVNLNSAIAHRAACVARVKLGDRDSGSGVRSVMLESPGRVINRRTSALRFKIYVGALVLHGLKNANGFAELLARLCIFDGDIERALHSANHFSGKSGRGNSARPRQAGDFTKLFSRRVVELYGIKFAREVHAMHRLYSHTRR